MIGVSERFMLDISKSKKLKIIGVKGRPHVMIVSALNRKKRARSFKKRMV